MTRLVLLVEWAAFIVLLGTNGRLAWLWIPFGVSVVAFPFTLGHEPRNVESAAP